MSHHHGSSGLDSFSHQQMAAAVLCGSCLCMTLVSCLSPYSFSERGQRKVAVIKQGVATSVQIIDTSCFKVTVYSSVL